MTIAYYLIDAFTQNAFAGNPAGVCLLDAMPSDLRLQQIASELNQPETAFVCANVDEASARKDDSACFSIRWFSPICEVKLCGHATLAAAHALWQSGRVSSDRITFSSRSGDLRAQRDDQLIILDFPACPSRPCIIPSVLAEAIGSMPFGVCEAGDDLLVEVGSADCVRDTRVNMDLILQLPMQRGLIICAAHDDPHFEIICRFFAPKIGTPEDHVTGSAHCALGPYFAKRFPQRETLRSHQASPRGGSLELRLNGERVLISGQACMIAEGRLHL